MQTENGVINLLQLVTELTNANATKKWMQSESRIHHVIRRCEATAGHRNSNFEATSVVSVTDCDNIHAYCRLVPSPSGSEMIVAFN